MAVASVSTGLLDPLRRQLLAEMGVVQYLLRSREPPPLHQHAAIPAIEPTAQRKPPVTPAVSKPPTAQSLAVAADGRRTLRFSGPRDAWKGLRSHLLRAVAGTEADAGADIMFGGVGSLLTLPALGALAANPALKRQAWMALRALRRAQ